MINLHESMELGQDRTCDPWICSQMHIYLSRSTSEIRVRMVPSNMSKLFLLTVPRQGLVPLWILFIICVSCLSVILPCLFLAALWSPDLLALLYVRFSCVFVTLLYVVLSQVWYLIVLIPDLCIIRHIKLQYV